MSHSHVISVTEKRRRLSHQTLQQARRPGDDDHQLLDELRDEGDLHALRALVSLETQRRTVRGNASP